MSYTRTQVMLSFLAGCLLLNGSGLLAIAATAFFFSHHMFIMGASSPVSYVLIAAILFAPLVLGVALTKVAFTTGRQVSMGFVVVWVLLAVLLLILQMLPLLLAVVGSLGIDFHFRP